MDRMWFVAALWLALALVAVLAANWLRISTALSEIVVGTVAQLVAAHMMGDRKSTRLNSSHLGISYAVFFLSKEVVWFVPLRRVHLLPLSHAADLLLGAV